MAQLEQAYQESRQRLKQQSVPEGGVASGGGGGTATPIKNEVHSTFSPGVTAPAATQLEINKAVSADSAGSTPPSAKGDSL